ncbi:hypothetical protein E1818_04430 [Salmonella enterica subsp. enterica serovar Blukwa]|nr:hypothetical protein [Salmonella enterica subsp. enterica serovar Blukwa]
MSHIFQNIDNSFKSFAAGAIDVTEWNCNGTKQDIVNVFTKYRDDYHPFVAWELSGEHAQDYCDLIESGDAEGACKIGKKYGKKLPADDSEKMGMMFFLQALGMEHLAQKAADDFYYGCIKREFYESHGELLHDLVRHEGNKIIASKPRNKNYPKAISIAEATWAEYPETSLGGMCRKLYGYFNGSVSIDSLDRWIKKAGINPANNKKKNNCPPFKLIIPV